MLLENIRKEYLQGMFVTISIGGVQVAGHA
jgi:hypothetical protein